MASINRAFLRKNNKKIQKKGQQPAALYEQAALEMSRDVGSRICRTLLAAAALTVTFKYGRFQSKDDRVKAFFTLLQEYVRRINRNELSQDENKVVKAAMDLVVEGKDGDEYGVSAGSAGNA